MPDLAKGFQTEDAVKLSLLALVVQTEGDSWRQIGLRLGSGVDPHHHLGGKELSQAGQEHQIEERRLEITNIFTEFPPVLIYLVKIYK